VLIKELTELNGVSGNEDEVRKFIKEEAQKYADSITEDSMGNLICCLPLPSEWQLPCKRNFL